MSAWYSKDLPASHHITALGWFRIFRRSIPLAILVFGGLALLLLLRLPERALFGARRPVTPYITQFVCRNAFRILGITFRIDGTPMTGPGAVVANHSSWLDIFALNARMRVYFVSKAEVAAWPGIGWLARATGTVFIARDPSQVRTQIEVFRERLAAGHRLLFFPEGTSTDGRRVLPFKPALFAAFFDEAFRDKLHIQPVTVVYEAPPGCDPRHYGWWGDMDFGPHFLATLAQAPQGCVTVRFHDPVWLTEYRDRKALAHALEETVRDGLVLDDV